MSVCVRCMVKTGGTSLCPEHAPPPSVADAYSAGSGDLREPSQDHCGACGLPTWVDVDHECPAAYRLSLPFDAGQFATVVADPPWPSMHQRSTYHRGKPERHYSTMTVEDILALDVGRVAAADAHLWVWGVNRLMEDAYRAVRAWGFVPMSVLTWCKPGPGMGYYLRNNTEHVIFATRGKPMVPEHKAMSSWYEWPRLRHSEKPAAFFEIVEQVSPGPRLEMFARTARTGWTAWGNEAPDVDVEGVAS